jgi:hypothetical protein
MFNLDTGASRAMPPGLSQLRAGAKFPEPAGTIAAIGRRWRTLAEQHYAIDEAILTLPDEAAREAAENRRDDIFDQMLDAQAEASAGRAETLADAATQAAVVMLQGEDLASNVNTVAEVRQIGAEIRRACASIVLALVRTGGLDIEQFGDTDLAACCARELAL